MKIFPLRPVSTLDRMQNLLNIMISQQKTIEQTAYNSKVSKKVVKNTMPNITLRKHLSQARNIINRIF